jgi:hypothetical protein
MLINMHSIPSESFNNKRKSGGRIVQIYTLGLLCCGHLRSPAKQDKRGNDVQSESGTPAYQKKSSAHSPDAEDFTN